MTTPSGQISVSDINTEVGLSSTYSSSLNFLNGYIVAGQRPSSPDMDDFKNKAYFQNNTQGNCNNGNCSTGSNCGNIQCTNCTLSTINCTNCDSQSWLQSNCNCACTYNCDQNANITYACNCACACACIACACACSDVTLKENIAPISGALEMVGQMRGVFFDWNDKANFYGKQGGNREVGVIANEMQKVLPEVVFNYKDVKSVDYGAINGVLIEAIKELKQEINELKTGK